MRINDAIKLQNARQLIKNEKNGKPKRYKFVNKAKLGRLIWKDQKGNRPKSSMSELINGKTKTIKYMWVIIICNETGIDPNFLFRKPSKHDIDYHNLVETK